VVAAVVMIIMESMAVERGHDIRKRRSSRHPHHHHLNCPQKCSSIGSLVLLCDTHAYTFDSTATITHLFCLCRAPMDGRSDRRTSTASGSTSLR